MFQVKQSQKLLPQGKVIVRPFHPDSEIDCIAVDNIERRSFCVREQRPVPRMLKDCRQTGGGIACAALPGVSADLVVGYMLFLPRPRFSPWKLHIDLAKIAIHPKHRGLGVGSLLLETFMETAKQMEITKATLMVRNSNSRARQLYERFGFTVASVSPGYYPDEDGLHMICRLQL